MFNKATQSNTIFFSVGDILSNPKWIESFGLWLQHISWQDWAWVGVLIHLFLTIFIIARILSTQRNTGVAIAWIVLLFAVPVVGLVAYFLVGEPFLGKRYKSRSVQAKQLVDKIALKSHLDFSYVDDSLEKYYQGVSRIGAHDTGFGVYSDHQMQLLTSPSGFFDALIDDINNAQTLILLEFYIVFHQGRVLEVFDALIKASQRGVECQLLADSVGSFSFFNDKWHKKLTEAGIVVHQSLPVGLLKTLFKRTDLRNHRKIIVIDEYKGYTGSFNLVDPLFFKQDKDVGQWIDVMMRIESHNPVNVVRAMAVVCLIDIGAESNSNLAQLSKRIDEYINTYTRKLNLSKPAIDDLHSKSPISRQAVIKTTLNQAKQYIVKKANSLPFANNPMSDDGSEPNKSGTNKNIKDNLNESNNKATFAHFDNKSDDRLSKKSSQNKGRLQSIINTKNEAKLKKPKAANKTRKSKQNCNNDKNSELLISNQIKDGMLIEKVVEPNKPYNSENKLEQSHDFNDAGQPTRYSENHFQNNQLDSHQIKNRYPVVNNVMAQVIPSAPRLTGHVIYETLLTLLHRANKRIQITTPYFVPDEALLSAITTAAKRGVDVTLIVPKKVDSFLVQHASQASYSILMESGVKIALFTGGLLHTKTVVIDDDYCLFGTVNMDMRSFYLNMEISLALFTPQLVAQIVDCQSEYLKECEWLEMRLWQSRSNALKLFDAGIRLFSPLL